MALEKKDIKFKTDSNPMPNARTITRLSDNWLFHRGLFRDAHKPESIDSDWRTVDLPHDWSIEDVPGTCSPFNKAVSGGGQATGYTVGGVGWYRKRLQIAKREGRKAILRVDGAMLVSKIFLNGRFVGENVNGYMPKDYDLTPYLSEGDENLLAICVENEGYNSRWYTGSGLYRHVWLTECNAAHINPDGIFVRTTKIEGGAAEIEVLVETERAVGMTVQVVLSDGTLSETVPIDDKGKAVLGVRVPDAKLWSPVDPSIYEAKAQLLQGSAVVDEVTVKFGIRTITVSAVDGLRINGKEIKLKGGNLHHDNGILGAAAYEDAEERRVLKLKEAGFNAIRTAHNPPSPYFLDMCDKHGMLVLDEAFDEWEVTKVPQGLGTTFKEHGEEQLTSMVRRDRNHPSVIFWSIGNEIPHCFLRNDIAKRLRAAIEKQDDSRPITEGVCAGWHTPGWVDWQTSSAPAFEHLDVGGYNYEESNWELDHQKYPERTMMSTESYAFDFHKTWQLIEKHPYCIGDFVWTAMDYIGESAIGQRILEGQDLRPEDFPIHLSMCGDLDIVGDRKPQSFYREAHFRKGVVRIAVERPLLGGQRIYEGGWCHKWGWDNVVSHWNHEGFEGHEMSVQVYSSCEEVELVLNGKSLGCKPVSDDKKAAFAVPYEPGELKAKGYLEGRCVEHILRTAGSTSRIVGSPILPTKIDKGRLVFVEMSVLDEQGILCPTAVNEFAFMVSGPATLIALGNADPRDLDSLQDSKHRFYQGRAMAVLKLTDSKGTIRATIQSESLSTCHLAMDLKA